ncbi:MAG TPA: hypothetical protein PLP29_09125 [Candidatus Ozemobacteraceae bacterium]|nr:hypothetical protein [Candidatus Ozemobacteraceae bacterium]
MKKPGGFDLPSRLWKNDEELDRLAGLPTGGKPSEDLASKIARNLGGPAKKPEGPVPAEEPVDPESDRDWRIHKVFAELHERHGRPFLRFLGDLLDIVLSGTLQTRLVREVLEDSFARMRRRSGPRQYRATSTGVPFSGSKNREEVLLGGEPYQHPKHYLRRKTLLATLFLDPDEYPGFRKLLRQVEQVCRTERAGGESLPATRETRATALRECLARLRDEITQADVLLAWDLLAADEFAALEDAFLETRSVSLVRPTYYGDLDAAYREAKKRLKQVIAEFETAFPPDASKQEAIMDSLQDLLEVYTHHHFVLKHYHQTRPSFSRGEVEAMKRDLQGRIDAQRQEGAALREECRRLRAEADAALADARAARQQAEDAQQKLKKLDPVEVERQMRAIEAKMNQTQREMQATLEEEAEIRKALREMDEENQELTRQLRELHALPDENAKSVEGLLKGKRVAIFGGVGVDHYWPVLREAGVIEGDYEWYDGYHTIPLSRTCEIVGRSDVVVVVTAYAGHLHLFQTRACIKPDQALLLIHKSGAGSLRKELIAKFGSGRG